MCFDVIMKPKDEIKSASLVKIICNTHVGVAQQII